MARVIFAAVAFIIFMSIGTSAIAFEARHLGDNYDINGETITASGSSFDAGAVIETTNSDISDAEYIEPSGVEVRDENGITMVQGVDYEWNENNGTVTILAGGSLTDDASLEIDYEFDIANEQQENIVNTVSNQLAIGEVMMYVFGAIIAVTFLRLLVGAG